MKLAEAESDEDGGGLTMGGITGAVILTVVIICIPTQELSPRNALRFHRQKHGTNMLDGDWSKTGNVMSF
jgi:hypothetical protein